MSLSASNYDQIIGLALRLMIKGDNDMGEYAQYLQTTLNGSDVGSLETTSDGLTYYVNGDIGNGSPAKIYFDDDGSGGISAQVNGTFFQVGKSSSSYSKITDTSTQGAYFSNGPCYAKMYYGSSDQGLSYQNASFFGSFAYSSGDYKHNSNFGPLIISKNYYSEDQQASYTDYINNRGIYWYCYSGKGISSLELWPNSNNFLRMSRYEDSYFLDINYNRGSIQYTDDFTDDTYTSAKFSIYNPTFSFNLSNRRLYFADNCSREDFTVSFDTDEDNNPVGEICFSSCGTLAMKVNTSTGAQDLYFNNKKVLTED